MRRIFTRGHACVQARLVALRRRDKYQHMRVDAVCKGQGDPGSNPGTSTILNVVIQKFNNVLRKIYEVRKNLVETSFSNGLGSICASVTTSFEASRAPNQGRTEPR